jgi:hypothetical protein
VRSGLSGGEQIVMVSTGDLEDGAHVTIVTSQGEE